MQELFLDLGKESGKRGMKELCYVCVHGFGNVFVEVVFKEAKQSE